MARAALCPMAVRPGKTVPFSTSAVRSGVQIWRLEGTVGSQFRAWTITSPGPAFSASYGFNYWLFHYDIRSGFYPTRPTERERRTGLQTFNIANSANVPVLLDSSSPGEMPMDRLPPRISSFCINRHNGRINGLFLDGSVREVGLKELWTLNWCPNFDTAGTWTLAGGVQREDWRQWMRGFKDY